VSIDFYKLGIYPEKKIKKNLAERVFEPHAPCLLT
jgi:hypothetical protein